MNFDKYFFYSVEIPLYTCDNAHIIFFFTIYIYYIFYLEEALYQYKNKKQVSN